MEHLCSVIIHHQCYCHLLLVLQPTYQYKVCNGVCPFTLHVPYIPSAPPSAPTNLTTTVLNATSVLLAWGPPNGTRSPSLFYRVLVTSGNGTQVYNKTVKELQLIHTTPDPCDQYWANVTAVYVSSNFAVCTGNSIMKAINGGETYF